MSVSHIVNTSVQLHITTKIVHYAAVAARSIVLTRFCLSGFDGFNRLLSVEAASFAFLLADILFKVCAVFGSWLAAALFNFMYAHVCHPTLISTSQ